MTKDRFYTICKPYTMTSDDRIYALFESMEYVRNNNIKGDFVECGVWAGGNILAIMEYMTYYNMSGDVWLYDTFEGMTHPDDCDIDHNQNKAKDILPDVMCVCSLDIVEKVLAQSSFPKNRSHYIVGDVVETLALSSNLPKSVALLRLDTDFYKSTKMEMNILYPILEHKGVLIVDDFGHWAGARLAVKEYFAEIGETPDVEVIDYTGIKIIKL